MTDNIDPKKLQEARQFVSSVTDREADLAKQRAGVNKALNAWQRVANKATQAVVQQARVNPVMSEALYTKEIQHPTMPNVMGVQTDKYAVYPMNNANGKTRYDVVSMVEQKVICAGLHLNDSASAIVKLLNRNYSFYSPEVKTILGLEESYTKHYNDAVSYKRKAKDNVLNEVMQIRFDESKDKFLKIKEELINFNKKLS